MRGVHGGATSCGTSLAVGDVHNRARSSETSIKEYGMLFLFTGFLKPHTEQHVLALRDEFNEHLAQPFPTIVFGGACAIKTDGKSAIQRFWKLTTSLPSRPIWRAAPFTEMIFMSSHASRNWMSK
jgi:hypothetical protein